MVAEPVKIRVVNYGKACQYNRLRNGIHHFRFVIPSREAVDIWVNHLSTITREHSFDEPMLMLVDIRQSGLLPMTYVFNRLQNWIPQNQQRAKVFLAVVHGKTAMVSIIRPFLRMLGVEDAYELVFFKDYEADLATDWLLEQQTVNS